MTCVPTPLTTTSPGILTVPKSSSATATVFGFVQAQTYQRDVGKDHSSLALRRFVTKAQVGELEEHSDDAAV